MKQMGSFVKFPCFPSELWFLSCPKKCIFLQFCAGLTKKRESVEAIYIYAYESFHYTLSENDMVYSGLKYRS